MMYEEMMIRMVVLAVTRVELFQPSEQSSKGALVSLSGRLSVCGSGLRSMTTAVYDLS